MHASLVFADGKCYPLKIDTSHASSNYGHEVLLCRHAVIDGVTFQGWRNAGAHIETDAPGQVARALDLPDGEPGIIALGFRPLKRRLT